MDMSCPDRRSARGHPGGGRWAVAVISISIQSDGVAIDLESLTVVAWSKEWSVRDDIDDRRAGARRRRRLEVQ